MKKLFVLLLVLSLLLCGCSSQQYEVSYDDDLGKIYYNGRTYVLYPDKCGKYKMDFDKCIELDEEHDIVFDETVLYYGDDKDNPNFITENRTKTLFVREDLCIDHSTTLIAQKDSKTISFTLEEATTDEVVVFSVDEKSDYAQVLEFEAVFEHLPQVSMNITISKRDDIYYLQDCWDSDYYVITEEFLEQLTQAFK